MLKSKRRTRSLKRVLGDFELPSFPSVAMRALAQLRDDSASADSVSETLAMDPGLSVRLLATVNTAAYAPRQRVVNLQQAVAMLGMANVESMVLAVAVESALPRPACRGFEPARFWRAAARRASAGRALAELLHPATAVETFTAALLQDMAVPLLAAARPREYGPVLERWHAGGRPLAEIERDALGIDHGSVGAWVCETWQLPQSLAIAVEAHHRPPASVAGCPPATALVAALPEADDPAAVDDLVAAAADWSGLEPARIDDATRRGLEAATDLAGLLEPPA